MPKRRHVLTSNPDQEELPGRQVSKQKAVRFLIKNFHPDHPWMPSEPLANWLGVDAHKLQVASKKDAPENIVWTTVCVLVFCATQLDELQEIWLDVGEQALKWLFRQANFAEIREDLVTSACALLDCKALSRSLLETLFHKRDRQQILDQEHQLQQQEEQQLKQLDPNDDPNLLGDWQICFLDEPPFTKYYWNSRTNKSQWHNPVEEERKIQEIKAIKQLKDQRLAKFLPLRFKLEHTKETDVFRPNFDGQKCEQCHRQLAAVYCDKCVVCKFLCDHCCDQVHAISLDMLSHVAKHMFFRECVGTQGFPRDATIKEFKQCFVEPTNKVTTASTSTTSSSTRPNSGSNKSRPATPKAQEAISSSSSSSSSAATTMSPLTESTTIHAPTPPVMALKVS